MKSLITAGTVFLVVLLVTPVLADKGQSSYKQGRDLEARQNYEGAYASYERAYDADPRDTRYRAALTRIRFLAAASKVQRATLLQQAGQLDDALILFEEAVRIDPSSPIASQQAINTRQMIQQARGNRAENASPSRPVLSPDILDAQGPVKLNGVSNLPVTLKLSQDTKIVCQTIGKLAGVNVLFDADFTSRQLNIELNGVTLQEALDLVAAESKTFWKPMTRNTMFVAADNPRNVRNWRKMSSRLFISQTSRRHRTPGSGEHAVFCPGCQSRSATRFSGSHSNSGNARSGSPGGKDRERL